MAAPSRRGDDIVRLVAPKRRCRAAEQVAADPLRWRAAECDGSAASMIKECPK
jgi:hypothetical protein